QRQRRIDGRIPRQLHEGTAPVHRARADGAAARGVNATSGAGLPVELGARLDDRRVVAGPGAFAVDLDVVEHELEVGTHVPVHAGSERVHGAAGHAGIVQVDGVVAEAELPHAGAGIVGQAGGGYAVLVSPGLARQVPQSADVAAAAGEIAGAGAVAGDVRTHVLALQLDRAVHPQRFQAGGRDAVGVGHGAGVDEAVGHVGARAHAQAQGV